MEMNRLDNNSMSINMKPVNATGNDKPTSQDVTKPTNGDISRPTFELALAIQSRAQQLMDSNAQNKAAVMASSGDNRDAQLMARNLVAG
jgi:hypothetical protein